MMLYKWSEKRREASRIYFICNLVACLLLHYDNNIDDDESIYSFRYSYSL